MLTAICGVESLSVDFKNLDTARFLYFQKKKQPKWMGHKIYKIQISFNHDFERQLAEII